jgi:hypothetical protein
MDRTWDAVHHVDEDLQDVTRRVLVTLDGHRILLGAASGAEPETAFLDVSEIRIHVIPGNHVFGEDLAASMVHHARPELPDADVAATDVLLVVLPAYDCVRFSGGDGDLSSSRREARVAVAKQDATTLSMTETIDLFTDVASVRNERIEQNTLYT